MWEYIPPSAGLSSPWLWDSAARSVHYTDTLQHTQLTPSDWGEQPLRNINNK